MYFCTGKEYSPIVIPLVKWYCKSDPMFIGVSKGRCTALKEYTTFGGLSLAPSQFMSII